MDTKYHMIRCNPGDLEAVFNPVNKVFKLEKMYKSHLKFKGKFMPISVEQDKNKSKQKAQEQIQKDLPRTTFPKDIVQAEIKKATSLVSNFTQGFFDCPLLSTYIVYVLMSLNLEKGNNAETAQIFFRSRSICLCSKFTYTYGSGVYTFQALSISHDNDTGSCIVIADRQILSDGTTLYGLERIYFNHAFYNKNMRKVLANIHINATYFSFSNAELHQVFTSNEICQEFQSFILHYLKLQNSATKSIFEKQDTINEFQKQNGFESIFVSSADSEVEHKVTYQLHKGTMKQFNRFKIPFIKQIPLSQLNTYLNISPPPPQRYERGPLLNFLSSVSKSTSSWYSSDTQKSECLELIASDIRKNSYNSMSKKELIKYLKDIILCALIIRGHGQQTSSGQKVLENLNNDLYREYRNMFFCKPLVYLKLFNLVGENYASLSNSNHTQILFSYLNTFYSRGKYTEHKLVWFLELVKKSTGWSYMFSTSAKDKYFNEIAKSINQIDQLDDAHLGIYLKVIILCAFVIRGSSNQTTSGQRALELLNVPENAAFKYLIVQDIEQLNNEQDINYENGKKLFGPQLKYDRLMCYVGKTYDELRDQNKIYGEVQNKLWELKAPRKSNNGVKPFPNYHISNNT